MVSRSTASGNHAQWSDLTIISSALTSDDLQYYLRQTVLVPGWQMDPVFCKQLYISETCICGKLISSTLLYSMVGADDHAEVALQALFMRLVGVPAVGSSLAVQTDLSMVSTWLSTWCRHYCHIFGP